MTNVHMQSRDFELELITSCTWEYIPGHPYFRIALMKIGWGVGSRPAYVHISPFAASFIVQSITISAALSRARHTLWEPGQSNIHHYELWCHYHGNLHAGGGL